MSIAIGEEVATYVDFDQFLSGRSQDTCGFATVILNHFAAERGKPYGASASTLQSMQAIWYSKFDGADVASNHNGMTLGQLYTLIKDVGNHYQNLFPDGGVQAQHVKDGINYWSSNGYPVIIAIEEASVFDMQFGACPYDWNTTGLSHIITVTGVTKSGNVLVRDTANVGRPGPREYDLAKLSILSATVFVPGWLPRPYSAFVVDAPTQHIPVPIVAPVAAPTPTNADIITALEQIDGAILKIIAAIKKTPA